MQFCATPQTVIVLQRKSESTIQTGYGIESDEFRDIKPGDIGEDHRPAVVVVPLLVVLTTARRHGVTLEGARCAKRDAGVEASLVMASVTTSKPTPLSGPPA